MSVLKTLIVPVAHTLLARELCEKIAPGASGSAMFVRALSPSGAAPATHYGSSGQIQQEFADLMTSAAATYAAAQASGIATTQAAVTALLAESDISSEEPFVALDRLGLKTIEPSA